MWEGNTGCKSMEARLGTFIGCRRMTLGGGDDDEAALAKRAPWGPAEIGELPGAASIACGSGNGSAEQNSCRRGKNGTGNYKEKRELVAISDATMWEVDGFGDGTCILMVQRGRREEEMSFGQAQSESHQCD